MPEVVAYRYANWDTPFWANPNRSAARYNRPESGPTQYLSLHPLTPWAEYLRRENWRTREELERIAGRLWCVRLGLPDDTVELTFNTAPDYDLAPEDLVSADHTRCRDWAERWRHADGVPQTVVVPSAALPGTRNIVIFGPRVRMPYLADPLDPAVDVPAAVAAESARPPLNLPELVCYRGDQHAGLTAWRRGIDPPPVDLPASV